MCYELNLLNINKKKKANWYHMTHHSFHHLIGQVGMGFYIPTG